MSSPVARLKSAARQQLDRFKHRDVYTRPHTNLDTGAHIHEASEWLKRAQDFGDDRGVSYGTRFGVGFIESYPETTGYIIPTFHLLADAMQDSGYERRAVEMGDWEIDIQMESGAVMGGRVNPDPTPAVFNTGQVLLGWIDLYKRTGEERFADAARRAAQWLVEVQDPTGEWIKGHSDFARGGSAIYNVRVGWALAWHGRTFDDDASMEAGVKSGDFALAHQRDNGWFSHCCLTDPERPLLHTLAYTMRGLYELGLLSGRDDFVAAATKTADALVERIDANGFMPGRYDAGWRPAVRWCCLTGSAQTSIVWSKLFHATGDETYRHGAELANRYLMAHHDLTSQDPAIRGGIAGSWPVWGDYGQFMILNWATKFFIDALLLYEETQAR
jgi:uncharacterized protein YyaL (SSP411 family)